MLTSWTPQIDEISNYYTLDSNTDTVCCYFQTFVLDYGVWTCDTTHARTDTNTTAACQFQKIREHILKIYICVVLYE